MVFTGAMQHKVKIHPMSTAFCASGRCRAGWILPIPAKSNRDYGNSDFPIRPLAQTGFRGYPPGTMADRPLDGR
jgi:hypothetical protein